MQDLLKKLLFGNAGGGNGGSPALSLSFTDGGTFDPRITFSRGTNATLTGSNGLIQYAPHNLLTNSEDFEAAGWTKTFAGTGIAPVVTANAGAAPDGTLTADRVQFNCVGATSSDRSLLAQTVTITDGAVYGYGIYVKAFSAGEIGKQLRFAGENVATPITVTLTADWQRITLSGTAAAGTTNLLLETRGTFTTNLTADVLLWGAQLNVGALQSYNATTPKNLLGFTQEPENAAWTKSNSYVQQNLLTWSQDFDNAAWVKTGLNTTGTPAWVNVAVAPDGATTADKFIEDTSTGTHQAAQTVTTTAIAYTYSVYAKAAERSFILLYNTTAGFAKVFNLATGAVGTGTVGTVTANISAAGNGWYRCSITGTATAAANDWRAYVVTSDTTTASYTGDGTSGLFLWGAQLVQGTDAGQYTQTTSAAAVTRYMNFDGTLTARKLVETTAASSQHYTRQVLTTVSGVPVTCAVYAKAGERTYLGLLEGFSNKGQYFNLANGTIGGVLSGAPTSASITNVGGGWYRCSITTTTTSTSVDLEAFLSTDGTTVTYTGDGTSGIYVSDLQLANSASVDPYVYNPQAAAASAAYYGPRFDFNPVTLAANGLLIEEQRTNLLTYSEQLDNAIWAKDGSATVTPNTYISPAGTLTADTLNCFANGDSTYQLINLTSGITYTGSVYVKYVSGSTDFRIQIGGTSFGGEQNITFNSQTGALVSNPNSLVYSVANVGNDWYRIAVSRTTTATGNAYWDLNANTAAQFALWGAQLEAGAFATSYIPTVASQVTRNADSASMLGDNFASWYNPNQGTLGAEASIAQLYTSASAAVVAEIGDGTNANRIVLFRNTSSGMASEYVFAGGVNQAALDVTNVFNANAVGKFAAAYALNDFRAAGNGVLSPSDTSGTLPAVNRLYIGNSIGSASYWNGWIRRVSYYNTRLADSTLQQITV